MSLTDLFGTEKLLDPEDFLRLVTRLGLNLGFATILIVFVYYRLYKNREFVFTQFIFNTITFSMCVLLRKVPTDLGFALGLFAVFGILRYRTEEIRIRDLTYLFIMIGIGIINGVSNKKISVAELLFVNGLIVALTALLELPAGARRHGSTPMLYDNLELLRPERREALIADLVARTGLDVMRVQVHRVDFLRDAAEVTVFHRGPSAAATEARAKEAPRAAA